MEFGAQATTRSTTTPRIGWVLSAIGAIFMIMDGGVKLFNPPPVVEAMILLEYTQAQTVVVGIICLLCVAIYLIPTTAVLGAILVTAYLGGAIASQLRIDAPIFSLIFPILIGLLFWGGLYLREPRLRALMPLG